VVVQADHDLGGVTIQILDHHRPPLATRTQAIAAGETAIAFRRGARVGALYVQIGAFRDWAVGDSYGQIDRAWGHRAEAAK
jgi:hypothetical protein